VLDGDPSPPSKGAQQLPFFRPVSIVATVTPAHLTYLLEVLEAWARILDSGYGVDVIYLDYKKPFIRYHMEDYYRNYVRLESMTREAVVIPTTAIPTTVNLFPVVPTTAVPTIAIPTTVIPTTGQWDYA